ncbi:RecQ family ATP-dependent DNA helicase [Aquipuribacter sp. SD81]|uniref:RecQ family ATP-dependent DNA helicase n=1 Tax=Aquipuribacter sp. SD81 TaxID=3127703 RepID=UPI00301A5454
MTPPVRQGVARHDAVRSVLGEDARLRPEQEEALDALRHSDVLLVARSGLGKTAVYDVAGRLRDGLTLVVSPTLSLQRDQVEALRATGNRADAVSSARTAAQRRQALEAAATGDLDVLLLAPEQLGRDEVVDALGGAEVGLLVVDEAHCVSEWGHDFRPDYLAVAAARERVGRPRTLAMTATASPHVRDEIRRALRVEDASVVVGDVDRPEIWLGGREVADERSADDAVVDEVATVEGAVLVYAQTRPEVERLVERLADVRPDVRGYHAGLRGTERAEVQDAFTSGELDTVVATSAFGMGIDRQDVRAVVHAGPSPSLDAYYQEVGRAGRDGEPARAVLVHRQEDFAVARHLGSGSGPKPGTLKAVAKALVEAGPLDRSGLAGTADLGTRTVARALGALAGVGAVEEAADGTVRWVAEASVRAVLQQVADARERRRATELSRVDLVRTYADTLDCRRRVLLGLLGEEHPEPCGRCDSCDAGRSETVEDARWHVGQQLVHDRFGEGTVSLVEPDRITVLFAEHGYTTLATALLDGDESPVTTAREATPAAPEGPEPEPAAA